MTEPRLKLTVKDDAERLRIGVRGGWIRIQEAVAWADNQIERTPQPHLALIDLALAHNRNREEVAGLLDMVPGSAKCTVGNAAVSERHTGSRRAGPNSGCRRCALA